MSRQVRTQMPQTQKKDKRVKAKERNLTKMHAYWCLF